MLTADPQSTDAGVGTLSSPLLALAQCGRVLLRATDEAQLAQETCGAIVGSGSFGTAWIGIANDDDARTIEPVASAGDDGGYIKSLRTTCAHDAFSRGPVAKALRSGRPQTAHDIATDRAFAVWRDIATARGFRSACTLPLIHDGRKLGVLCVLARRADAFPDDVTEALDQLADDIAYRIVTLREQASLSKGGQFLLQSENFSRATLDALSDHVCVLDQTGRVVAVNAAWRKFGEDNGAAASAVCAGSNYLEVCDAAHRRGDAGAKVVADGIRAILDGRIDALRHEYPCHGPGVERWFVVSITRFPGAAPAHVVLAHENVTQRKLAEARALRLEKLYRALSETNAAIARMRDQDAVLQAACDIAVRQGGFMVAAVRQVDPRTNMLETVQSSGDDRSYLQAARISMDHTDPAATGPTATALRESRVVVHNDFAAEPALGRWHADAARAGIRAYATIPICNDGAVIAGFSVYAGEPNVFDDGLVDLLRRMADSLGLALDRFQQEAQRLQADQELRDSEGRYRALFELYADYYWEQDAQYRFTGIWGRPGVESLSMNADYIGKARWEIPRIVDVTRESWAAHRAVLDRHEPFRNLILSHIDTKGDLRCLSVSGVPIIHSDGTFKGYQGISRDVTAEKQDDQLLRLEHRVTRCLADADDASTALRMLMQLVCETEGWECCRFLRIDKAENVLRQSDHWAIADPDVERFIDGCREVTYAAGEGLSGRVWQSGQAAWSTDIRNDPRLTTQAQALALDMRSALVFPIVATGNVIGVLVFNTRISRDPDARLQRAMGVICNQIGQFLQRKQAESELRRFRAAIDLVADSVLLADRRSMRYIDANEGACRLLGYTRQELLSLSPQDLLPMDRDEVARMYDSVIEGRAGTLTSTYRRKDGELVNVESVRGAVPYDDGWIVVGIARDISTRLAAEAALRSSSERFDLVARATSDIIWDWNPRTNSVWWNSNFELMFGYPAPPSRSDAGFWSELIHPEDRDRVLAGFHATIGGDKLLWSDEYRIRCADGRHVHVYDRGYIVRDADGSASRMIGAMSDLTGQKTTEEVLRRLARREGLLAELGRLALAELNADSLLAKAVFVLCGALGFEYGKVLQLSPDGHGLILRAAYGWPEHDIGRRVMTTEQCGQAAHALAGTDPILVEDFATESRFSRSPLAASQNIVCGIEVAIPGETGPFGVIGVHSATKRELLAEDVTFVEAVASVLATALRRKHAEQQLTHLAQFDALTGLPNRHLFGDRLAQAIVQAKRASGAMALFHVNLDRFKLINETFGHDAGDRLLVSVSQRLAGRMRAGDTVSRLHTDEFGIIASGPADIDAMGSIAEMIIAALGEPFDCDGVEVFLSASVGIATFPGDSDHPDGLIRNADIAMYRAKELGSNRYQFYAAGMNQRAEARFRNEGELRHALARGEFLLHFQPMVDVATGRASGAEALLRWRHPQRGLVSPGEFIPILEETGAVVQVGLWVLRTACEQLGRWRSTGINLPVICVNLSPRQFQQDDLVERVVEITASTGTDPGRIEFEITESMLMTDPELARSTLNKLKAHGFKLAVDDFGTGYSSLAYLKRFPLDTLKVDRAFVSEIATNPDDAAIVLAIINLAHNLRLRVVAEGVENEPQVNFLKRHGCDVVQGYYFSRPVEADALARTLSEDRLFDVHDRSPHAEPTLLALDDSADDLSLLQEALSGEGYRIHTARNATRAFELLAGQEVDMVVSDQHMPGMSGVEFLSRVKQIHPDVIRVMATGSQDPATVADAVNRASVHYFMSKDWGPERIRETLRDAFRKSHPKLR